MIKNFFSKVKILSKIKFRFDFPSSKKILLFDETHSESLKKIIKKNFNILKVRSEKEIYFWIFFKQIIYFDFKFMTYCKNYIKFLSPKIVITFIDTNREFYELKNFFKKINFISIQDGCRVEKNTMFYNKSYIKTEKLKCDHSFVFNEYYIEEYQRIIKSNYHVLGNFKNNLIQINRKKRNKNFLFISQYSKNHKRNLRFIKKLANLINLYLSRSNKKIYILLRYKEAFRQNEEINFYKKIFQSKCIFKRNTHYKKSYELIDEFENIIFLYSTLGFEAIARKKKVAIFSPIKNFDGTLNFAWPAPYQKKYNFFSSNKLNYNEIKRVLNNVYNCSQNKWEKKYYSIIKDQLYFNKSNTKLKKVIYKLLKK